MDSVGTRQIEPLRKFLIEYCRKTTPSIHEKKYYKLGWFQGNDYFGFPIDSVRILAASELEAVLIFKDFQNKCIDRKFDAYDDECFWDSVNSYNNNLYESDWGMYKTDEFLKTLFASACIDEIIENYIRGWLDNDTLWLDIATEPKTLTANF
jgi:hypothetical protein